MHDWKNKYNRNAVPGEIVHYYYAGTGKPVEAIVTESGGVCCELSLFKVRSSRHECISSVRHIDDPHWKKLPHQLAATGAWDFHPIWGGLVNGQLNRMSPKTDDESTPPRKKASTRKAVSV